MEAGEAISREVDFTNFSPNEDRIDEIWSGRSKAMGIEGADCYFDFLKQLDQYPNRRLLFIKRFSNLNYSDQAGIRSIVSYFPDFRMFILDDWDDAISRGGFTSPLWIFNTYQAEGRKDMLPEFDAARVGEVIDIFKDCLEKLDKERSAVVSVRSGKGKTTVERFYLSIIRKCFLYNVQRPKAKEKKM